MSGRCRVVGGHFEGDRPAGGAHRCRVALGERDRPAARRALLRSQGTDTWIHTTHHHPIAYYYDDATQRPHIFTVHYHYYTPKFPSHTVGVPPAGSFYRFKLLSPTTVRSSRINNTARARGHGHGDPRARCCSGCVRGCCQCCCACERRHFGRGRGEQCASVCSSRSSSR